MKLLRKIWNKNDKNESKSGNEKKNSKKYYKNLENPKKNNIDKSKDYNMDYKNNGTNNQLEDETDKNSNVLDEIVNNLKLINIEEEIDELNDNESHNNSSDLDIKDSIEEIKQDFLEKKRKKTS